MQHGIIFLIKNQFKLFSFSAPFSDLHPIILQNPYHQTCRSQPATEFNCHFILHRPAAAPPSRPVQKNQIRLTWPVDPHLKMAGHAIKKIISYESGHGPQAIIYSGYPSSRLPYICIVYYWYCPLICNCTPFCQLQKMPTAIPLSLLPLWEYYVTSRVEKQRFVHLLYKCKIQPLLF